MYSACNDGIRISPPVSSREYRKRRFKGMVCILLEIKFYTNMSNQHNTSFCFLLWKKLERDFLLIEWFTTVTAFLFLFPLVHYLPHYWWVYMKFDGTSGSLWRYPRYIKSDSIKIELSTVRFLIGLHYAILRVS